MTSQGMSRRKFLQLTGVVGSGLLLGACSAGNATPRVATAIYKKPPTPTPIVTTSITNAFGREMMSDAAAPGDQLLYEPEKEPKHLDTARDPGAAHAVLNWGTESLLRLDDNWEPVPSLAESFSAGPNAEYFDFRIREGAKWSDGTPITAADVVFTFRHLSDPALGSPWVWYFFDIKGIKARWTGQAGPEQIGVEAVDERTVRVRGEGPVPHLPQLLSVQGTGPIPKHVAEKNPEHWADRGDGFVSCGPFTLAKWEPGKSLEWKANPQYNGPIKPALERVIQHVNEPSNGWFWEWKERNIDLIHDFGFANIRAAQTTAVIVQQMHYLANAGTEYLALDTTRPPLNNPKLRQALAQALDRDKWCSGTMAYTRSPAYSMLPPEFPAYSEALQSVQAFDVDKAKALLAEAGYPEGKDTSGKQLELELEVNADDTYISFLHGDLSTPVRGQETADFIVAQWAKNLGIAVKVTALTEAEWKKGRAERTLPMYISFQRYEYRDPAYLLGTLWRSVDAKGSFSHAWKSDAFDQAVAEAAKTADSEQRLAAYQKAERVLVEDVGAVFISHNSIYTMWWPHLTGIHFTPDGLQVFRPDFTRYELYIRGDYATWREQSGTVAIKDQTPTPTPGVK